MKQQTEDSSQPSTNLQERIDKYIVDQLKVEPSVEIYKYLFSTNMELFAKYYFSDKLNKPNSIFHKWLYRKATKILNKKRGKGIKLAVASPRGYAKSTLISFVLPLWCICFNRKKYIILISDTEGQATDYLDDIKNELISNELLSQHYPKVFGKSDIRWRVDDIVTRNDIRIRALGSGGKIRGRAYRRRRPDLICGDDLENSEHVESDTARARLRFSWFDKEVMHAGQLDGSTDYIVVGTVIHEDSLLSNLLKRSEYPDWERKRFKAVLRFSDRPDLWEQWRHIYLTAEEHLAADKAYKFYKEHEAEMLKGTKVLWPAGETYYDLMVMCLTPEGQSAFAGEKQNEPIDVSRVLVTKDQLHYFRTEELDFSKLKFYGAWDPSKGKKARKGDFSAIVILARDNQGIIYVLEFDLKRREVDKRIIDIFNYHQNVYPFSAFTIEDTAFQYYIKETLVKRSREYGIYLPIRELNRKKYNFDKKLKIESLVPFILDGTIRFRYPAEWTLEYREGVNQLIGFNAGAKHDDAPDALAMAFDIAKSKTFVRKALIQGRVVPVAV